MLPQDVVIVIQSEMIQLSSRCVLKSKVDSADPLLMTCVRFMSAEKVAHNDLWSFTSCIDFFFLLKKLTAWPFSPITCATPNLPRSGEGKISKTLSKTYWAFFMPWTITCSWRWWRLSALVSRRIFCETGFTNCGRERERRLRLNFLLAVDFANHWIR